MRRAWLLVLLLLPVGRHSTASERTSDAIVVVPLQGPIGPASAHFAEHAIEQASKSGARAVVLRIDTPGGLDTSMRVVIQAVLASRVPVVGFVAPEGARAASAGTFIMYATHLAAMAPGTNLGAATPVELGVGGGEEDSSDEASRNKAINDAAAYIQSLAELRGRNAAWAVRAVRSGASLSAVEAQKAGVVELVARDLDELRQQAQGRRISLDGETRTLDLVNVEIVTLEPGWSSRALGVITSPNVVVLLLLFGVFGLFFELASPGTIFPGVFGAIFLLLGLYGLHVLPVSGAGAALLLLGLALVIAEAFVPSFGILGISGTLALVLGGFLLIQDETPEFAVSPWVLVVALLSSLGLMGLVLRTALAARRRPVTTGKEGMVGATAVVLGWHGLAGEVLVMGERWQACSSQPLLRGDRVRVRRVEDLTLTVTPTSLQQEREP